ncbi:MAG: hypothetical protein LBI58_01030 [Tannerellaceae bacterium]|jgi:hypothetical protein|nr:hypothetical protein [Tannerellaceae bacterium]
MAEKEDLQYDEEESVKFIQESLPAALKGKFNDDDILYLLDLAEEYYTTRGDIDAIDDDDDSELLAYITKNAREDGFTSFEAGDISFVLDGDLEYCRSIGMID